MRQSLIRSAGFVAGVVVLIAANVSVAQAYDPDWKRGRTYYKAVCTSCHTSQTGDSIAPSTMTKAQWTAYLQADKHAKGKDTVKKYLSKAYRKSIQAESRAAAKYVDVDEQQLFEDLKAFVMKGAKDGDAPASCS